MKTLDDSTLLKHKIQQLRDEALALNELYNECFDAGLVKTEDECELYNLASELDRIQRGIKAHKSDVLKIIEKTERAIRKEAH